MAMTKKDFELVARAILSARTSSTLYSTDATYQHALNMVSLELSFAFESINPRFSVPTFYSASGYGKLPRESEVRVSNCPECGTVSDVTPHFAGCPIVVTA